jgi:hypothetical protein
MSSTKPTDRDRVADAIRATLISPNVADSNFEPANVVDALALIARAIYRLAEVIETKQKPP